MRNTELVVLRGFVSETEISDGQRDVFGTADGGPLLRLLLEGDFEAVLLSPPVLDLLTGDGGTSENLEAYLEERVLTYLDAAAGDQTQDRETVVLAMAVSCLGLFAQSNWTGPPITLQVSDLLPVCVLDRYSEDGALTSAVLSHLLLDGECVYSLVLNPFLLLVARVLLVNCATKLEHLQLLPWWTLRYTALHQQILEERSPQLFSLAKSCMDKVCMREDLLSDGAHRNLALLFHLECSYACLTYYEYRKAKDHLQKARQLSGLEINMTGALGKRTRFQENFLAQLILSVKRKDDSPVPESEGNLSPAPTPRHLLPKDHQLDDDTVLNQMTLAEPCELQLPELRAEEQALILGVCTDFQKNNPVHKLNEEELLAFTTGAVNLKETPSRALAVRVSMVRSTSSISFHF
ncbi:tetratricopeptide repeat protein 27-like [Brachyhypopomus gauderio]|uniref:tetratricopeptide repeat protein 27-like n=1 Tax=Brachyhypopomus gauderio TaxID=698409 RepID=UPI00404196FE